MLVNSVIIVLREVLEAALMISILLAISQRLQLRRRWLIAAVAGGLAGAVLYAEFLAPISDLFDGVGQELLNAAIQTGVVAALLCAVFLIVRIRASTGGARGALSVAMAMAVSLSAAHEGSEILLYVSGFLHVEEFVSSVAIGSITGAGIGFSVGVLFYYLLLALRERRALWISLVLLSLAASSMCIQVAKMLIQADWLSANAPVWNSSWLIPEDSLIGQLMYALVGYEATPSALEVGAYAAGLLAMAVVILAGWWSSPVASGERE